jgi:flagella basal body P-ring formation protein FlgA
MTIAMTIAIYISRLASRCAAISAIAVISAVSNADTIRMVPSVRIASGKEITLADLADLDGADAESLATTVVGRGENGAFEIGVDRVRQQLVVAGANLRKIEFIGEKTVVRPLRGTVADTTDAARTIACNGGLGVAAGTMASSAPGMRLIDPAKQPATGTPLAIICEMVRNAFGADACDLRLEMSADQLEKIAPIAGVRYEVAKKSALRSARIEFEVIGRPSTGTETRTRIRVNPRFEREVLVARADVRRGVRADGESTTIETRMLTLDEASDAVDPHKISETTFIRAKSKGATIDRTDIARENDIHRHETVTVRREVGMVAIEFEAIALEDGTAGDIIAFEKAGTRHSRDRRLISAEIVGPGRAVIR